MWSVSFEVNLMRLSVRMELCHSHSITKFRRNVHIWLYECGKSKVKRIYEIWTYELVGQKWLTRAIEFESFTWNGNKICPDFLKSTDVHWKMDSRWIFRFWFFGQSEIGLTCMTFKFTERTTPLQSKRMETKKEDWINVRKWK